MPLAHSLSIYLTCELSGKGLDFVLFLRVGFWSRWSLQVLQQSKYKGFMTSSLLEEPSLGLIDVLLLQPSVLQDLND